MDYKISVIVPVYNVERYILSCLESVANQTMTEGIECILVDDCGKDNSVAIAEGFIRNYKGNICFSLIRHEHNRGLSAARNTGIMAAKGDYLYFLDSDDEITPDCMKLMYSYVNKYGNVDLVQGSFYETEEEKTLLSSYGMQEYTQEKVIIKKFLLTYAGDVIPAQSRLVKHDFLVEYSLYFKEGIIHEDNYWTFFIAKYVSSMCFCKVRTYYHRYNPNSITGNINIEKERYAYMTIIMGLTKNIDSFLPGIQKEYILNNMITAINGGYYTTESEREEFIQSLCRVSNVFERALLLLYFKLRRGFIKTKILHLLIRLYKL